MKTPKDDSEAVRVYRHTFGEVAEGQVVAAAEDILCDTWVDELERCRSTLVEAASCAHCPDQGSALRDVLRDARREGDPDEIALAEQRLAAYDDCRHMGLDETCHVLDLLPQSGLAHKVVLPRQLVAESRAALDRAVDRFAEALNRQGGSASELAHGHPRAAAA